MNPSLRIAALASDLGSYRCISVVEVDRPRDLLQPSLTVTSRYFAALLLWDAVQESDDEIAIVARRLLDLGCVYFCCWGPDCERVHDVIDGEYLKDGLSVSDDGSTIMTTWHANETLAEATWFAVHAAFPDDRFFDSCNELLVLNIGTSGGRSLAGEAIANALAPDPGDEA